MVQLDSAAGLNTPKLNNVEHSIKLTFDRSVFPEEFPVRSFKIIYMHIDSSGGALEAPDAIKNNV